MDRSAHLGATQLIGKGSLDFVFSHVPLQGVVVRQPECVTCGDSPGPAGSLLLGPLCQQLAHLCRLKALIKHRQDEAGDALLGGGHRLDICTALQLLLVNQAGAHLQSISRETWPHLGQCWHEAQQEKSHLILMADAAAAKFMAISLTGSPLSSTDSFLMVSEGPLIVVEACSVESLVAVRPIIRLDPAQTIQDCILPHEVAADEAGSVAH